jgi:hypothetical protein
VVFGVILTCAAEMSERFKPPLGIKDLGEKDFAKYYEVRLGRLRKNGWSWMANCIFHEDHRPSLAVRLDVGVWKCHGCGKGGGVLDMETFGVGYSAPPDRRDRGRRIHRRVHVRSR